MGGDAFLRSLEEVASNTLLISRREEVNVVSTFEKALNRLFEEHVQRTEVIPFVTLYDVKGTKLGIIVEPTYTLANLAGGSYYLDVSSNPSCAWTIQIAPA